MTLMPPFDLGLAARAPGETVAFGAAPEASVTVGALAASAAAVADALGPAGNGAAVVVLCHDRARFAAALLGAWEAGYTVALPPNATPDTVRAVRREPGVVTVLHDGDDTRGLDVRALGPGAPRRLAPLAPGRALITLYTSGSTGAPRPIAKNTAQLLGEATALVRAFGDLERARVLAVPPPHHIYGLLFGVLVPLVGRGAFFRGPAGDPGTLAAALRAGRADVLVSVPAHLRTVAALEAGALPPLRRVFSSGAPLLEETGRALARAAGWTVTEVLGSSETGGIAWRARGDAPAPPWTPLPGVAVAEGEDARLALESPFLDPSAPRPYVGGDRVRVHADGRFEHLGRADGVLKIGAVRVSVAEVEARLQAVPGVRDAAVLPVEVGGARGFELWAAVVAPGLDVAALRAALRRWLAPVALPRRYRFVEALPRSPAGKVPRAALLALFDAPPAPAPPAPGDGALGDDALGDDAAGPDAAGPPPPWPAPDGEPVR